RHDEADARIKFFGMPLDLGDNPPRLGPGSSLIAEIGMEPPDFIGRSSDRTLEQVANPTLQDLVSRQPDRILDQRRRSPSMGLHFNHPKEVPRGSSCGPLRRTMSMRH